MIGGRERTKKGVARARWWRGTCLLDVASGLAFILEQIWRVAPTVVFSGASTPGGVRGHLLQCDCVDVPKSFFPIGTLVAENQVLAVGSELRIYAGRVASWRICGAAARGGQGMEKRPPTCSMGSREPQSRQALNP